MLKAIISAFAFWLQPVLALVKYEAFRSGPPQKSNVLILLRGQTFREQEHDERFACKEFAKPSQLNNTISVVKKIIEPLEQLGNKVDVISTDAPCSLTKEVNAIYGERIVASASFKSGGQAENMRRALDTLNTKCGGAEKVSGKYDYVLVLRHDGRFVLEFNDWQADWSTINFFARCEDDPPPPIFLGSQNCVWDTVHLVPGKLYETFNSVIGRGRVHITVDGEERRFSCFWKEADPNGHGHACYYPMLAALQEKDKNAKLGVILPMRFRVRAKNDYLDLKLPRGDQPPPQEWRSVSVDAEELPWDH